MSGGVLGVLQARTSSSRLPGKVLLPLLGVPMLMRQIERLQRARHIDQLIVATSVDASDDALAALCTEQRVACHRGALDDVLDRFIGAARPFAPAHVVRLTGDCPLADPALIDALIARHLERAADYSTNAVPPSYPDGLDAEVVRMEVLETAHREARLASEREHVTQFIVKRPERFRIEHLVSETDLSALRWTVDEPADFALVETIYAALYPHKPDFSAADILALIRTRPELATLNTQHTRNEGLARSLAREASH